MLIMWQALAFAACVLFDLLPSSEVQCRFDAPVVALSPPPSPAPAKPAEPPVADPPPAGTSADRPPPGAGPIEPRHD